VKRSRIILAWCVLAPGVLQAQEDVRVRLYTARPPDALSIRGVGGEIHWRTCPKCAEFSGRELSVAAADAKGSAEFFVSGRFEIRAASGPSFLASYPAHIERHDGHLLVTVTMTLEDYVASVLMGESGDFENVESRKAMAVVARTYAVRFIGQHENEGFDFCDTTHCQVIGWKRANAAIRAAVSETHGEVLRFEGKLAATYYHQNCGGTTAGAQEVWPTVKEAYLTSHADTYCAAGGVLKWESAIRVPDLNRALRAAGLTIPERWRTIEIASRSESGRVRRLKLTGGGGGDAHISASTFRFAVDRELGWEKIRSDLYEVRNEDGQIIFSGRGSGHGVGLCQAGAEEMAREGKSYREILSFYFPGTQLGTAVPTGTTDKVAWQKRGTERVDLLSTQPDADAAILPAAEKILKEDEDAIGWKAAGHLRLQVYATLDAYRDTTGQPGWVAAFTRGNTIRLQPLKELERRAIVESTLRHEIFHVLVEAKAKAGTPLWFREGIVLYLSNQDGASEVKATTPEALTEEQMEAILRQPRNREEVARAYAAAQIRVAELVQQHGKETVLGWLSSGIPGDVRGSSTGSNAASHQ
jgi:stage II sporulation protein D